MVNLCSLIFLSYSLFAIELKSYKPPTNLATKNADSITCDFSAKVDDNKVVKLKTEVFKSEDLATVHDDGTQGIYVNVFDFLGYSFHMDKKKQLHIKTEKEEVEKKELKSFSRLPASLKTKVEFSTIHNEKSINLKEVTLVCKP